MGERYRRERQRPTHPHFVTTTLSGGSGGFLHYMCLRTVILAALQTDSTICVPFLFASLLLLLCCTGSTLEHSNLLPEVVSRCKYLFVLCMHFTFWSTFFFSDVVMALPLLRPRAVTLLDLVKLEYYGEDLFACRRQMCNPSLLRDWLWTRKVRPTGNALQPKPPRHMKRFIPTVTCDFIPGRCNDHVSTTLLGRACLRCLPVQTYRHVSTKVFDHFPPVVSRCGSSSPFSTQEVRRKPAARCAQF